MNVVELGSQVEGTFTLTDSKRGPDGQLWSVVATLEVGGLHAVKEIRSDDANGMDDLIDYLSDLADHWQGWEGKKHYESFETRPGPLCSKRRLRPRRDRGTSEEPGARVDLHRSCIHRSGRADEHSCGESPTVARSLCLAHFAGPVTHFSSSDTGDGRRPSTRWIARLSDVVMPSRPSQWSGPKSFLRTTSVSNTTMLVFMLYGVACGSCSQTLSIRRKACASSCVKTRLRELSLSDSRK